MLDDDQTWYVTSVSVFTVKSREPRWPRPARGSRRYHVCLEPVGDHITEQATSTSKSAISRRFVKAIEHALAERREHADQLQQIQYTVGAMTAWPLGSVANQRAVIAA